MWPTDNMHDELPNLCHGCSGFVLLIKRLILFYINRIGYSAVSEKCHRALVSAPAQLMS